MSTVISVENLGKKYTLHHQQREPYMALRDVLTQGCVNLGKRVASVFTRNSFSDSHSQMLEDFWALKDVSFEVKQGDRIGIIGRNGAGKSTLLKILSRITEPTTGCVKIKGRVASLLEVGTGFHPELTGRENIYLNGAILGMSRAEIKKKFDEIVDFAEIEKFLDTPVKRYSSGMYVRLAFAVAAHLEPEILVVDEVLAVGDAQFQKKCLGKMEDVSAREGRTVLFVSHNMSAISALCSKCVLIDKGTVLLNTDVASAIAKYMSGNAGCHYERHNLDTTVPRVTKAWLENDNGDAVNHYYNGDPVRLVVETRNPPGIPLEISLSFWDEFRRPLWNFTHAMHGFDTIPDELCVRTRLIFYPPKLSVGQIFVDMAIGPKGGAPFLDYMINALRFNLIEKGDDRVFVRYSEWPILCDAKITTELT